MKRANILIVDEFRMVDLDIITKVLRKFLTAPRYPKYLDNPKYAHLQERNKEIYLSSAWYKFHWSWTRLNTYFKAMLEEKRYFVCGLPYQLSLKENLLMREQVLDEMSEDDFDDVAWAMEMQCLFFGENEKAYYKLDEIQKCRVLKKAFYPIENELFLENKGKRIKSSLPKQSGEIRIISMDIALMEGDKNDNTVFVLMRLLPSGDKYIRQVVYIESMNGEHSTKQAIRLKQLFYDFEADYVIMDTLGNGISVYDDVVKVLYDEERDIEYPAWTCINDEKMANRSMDSNALKIVYSMKTTSRELNHEIATNLKNALRKKKVHLLVNDIVMKEEFKKKSQDEKIRLLKPYIQTTLMVNEIISLDYSTESGFIKVKEKSGKRKDRYSSIAYCNYYASLLEKELSGEADFDPDDEVIYY